MDLLRLYVAAHNSDVTSGKFQTLVALFHEHAEIQFEGVEIGPFIGSKQIAHAFETSPPDDKLDILKASGEGESATAVHGWRGSPGTVAGTLLLEARAGSIVRLKIIPREPESRARQ